MIADVDTFADGLLMGFTQLFSGLLTIFGTLLFMLWENVPITLVVVCITPLSLVVASFLAKRSYKYFQGQSTVRGEQTALVNEMIEGQKVVQAFGHEAESLASFDEVNTQLQDVSLKAIFFSSMTNPATRFVNNIVYAGVGLVGAIYAVAGGITIGQLSIFLNYANQYTKPFNEISGVVTELQNALACAARVFELLDADDQVPEAEHARVLQPDGHVELKDVSFRYLPDRPLIEGLNLDVKPGQRIAIVGPTGCGKTTLINLLMRFYDVNSGSITVSGDDIRNVTRASCAAATAWCCRTPGCAPAPSARTSPTASPTPPTKRSLPRPRQPTPTASSAACRTVTIPSSRRTAATSARARSSCSASPASCSACRPC